MISGHGNIETAVSAIKMGAYDFIEKPFKADRLVLVAERALEASRLKREIKRTAHARWRAQPHHRQVEHHQSAPPGDRARRAGQFPRPHHRRAGRRQGACGARPSMRRRARAYGPFVVINSATITPDMMEIELFGVEARDGRRAARSARSRRRMAARSISTRSPICRRRRRARFCGFSSIRISSASAARRASTSMCASFHRARAICPRSSPKDRCAKISSIGFPSCRSAYRRCPNIATIFQNSSISSWISFR